MSCMAPDAVQTFQFLNADPDPYFVIHGTLDFDPDLLPPAVADENQRNVPLIPARFTGKGLSAAGFVTDYISDVTLQVTCAGPWCGSATSGTEVVIFVPATDPPVMVEASPCGAYIFENPTQATLDALTTCMQGGPCSAQPLQ